MALLLLLLRVVAVVACRGVPVDVVLPRPPLLPVCSWTPPLLFRVADVVGRRGGPAEVVRAPPLLLPVWRSTPPPFRSAAVTALRVDGPSCARSSPSCQVEVISGGPFGFAPALRPPPFILTCRSTTPLFLRVAGVVGVGSCLWRLCSRVGLSFWSTDGRCLCSSGWLQW